MPAFLPGLELNRRFHAEAVRPILAEAFPGLVYAAALIGYGSDVLGYDTVRSTDHEWGPRLLLFLRPEDEAACGQDVDATLREHLPPTFAGYPTNFSQPDTADGGVRRIEPSAGGPVNHHVQTMTIDDLTRWELGMPIPVDVPLTSVDWLTFTEQKLLEVTAGAVYHDGWGQLTMLREQLAYYPHDVWLYRLSAQWQRISQEEAFLGRCGEAGDDLGSRLVAARLVRDLMRLCFLLERRYAPYSKWIGTAFSRLEGAEILTPLFTATLSASDWHEREQPLAQAYAEVARRQNALGLTPAQDERVSYYHNRPFLVIHADRFAAALAGAITDDTLRRITRTPGLIGAVDQWVDSTDMLGPATHCRALGAVYNVGK